jgi:Spy/CpxP family protein refolding chaperone
MSILPRALSLSLLLVVALATASSARPPWGRGQAHGPGGLLEEHVDQLGLDEETREAIRDVVRESRESSEELRDELRGLHREMKRALSQDAPDESAVMLLADRIGMLETSLHKHRLAAMLAIRSVLTPEQREQLAELREEVADACREDALQLCPTAEGRFERMQCMREHRDEVSDACRGALQDLRRERPHKRWGGGR